MKPIPDLVDNHKNILAQVLKDVLAGSQKPRLDTVTAFFNLSGLDALNPEIENIERLRLLLGKEQNQPFVIGMRLLAELEDATASGETTINDIKRWEGYLSRDCVEIKLYSKTFVHGKAYIIQGVPGFDALGIVGSSNFTGAGLTTNLELNAVLKQNSAVRELSVWFEELWAEADDYKAELLKLLKRFTFNYSPYEIYIKVIYEALRDQVDQNLGDNGQKPSAIALADFQHDGYLAAKDILENYRGVFIADSVGLGKTYLALRLLDDYAYRERQTALIVCPAAVSETVWRGRLQHYGIPNEIVSTERVSREDFPVDEYAKQFKVIVVDESHNFRNPATNRWENLFKLIAKGDPDKKIILLTATPVNNTVFDLYHQLRLITRDDKRLLIGAGIKDLWEYFRLAEEKKESLYELLEAIAVRRSRSFIHKNYPDAKVDGEKVIFPERELHTVHYSLKKTYGPNLYNNIAKAIENLFLAPYQVETFRKELIAYRNNIVSQLKLFETKDEKPDSAIQRLQNTFGWSFDQARDFLMAVGRQTALAQILKVLYLKRLESSIPALKISLKRLHSFLELFLKALDAGVILDANAYRKWLQLEGSEDEEEKAPDIQTFFSQLPKLNSEIYDMEKIRNAVKADICILDDVLKELEQEREDSKLQSLKDLIASPEFKDRKVILFSYFKDTARYIYENLLNDEKFIKKLGGDKISIVDSDVDTKSREARINRFAPKSNLKDIPPEEQIDILVSTDVLSEGQNLQDAGTIINYDLHWNPVRMVQRIGRLDRIGSLHSKIHVYNFFPEEELEELLGILKRLDEKLNAINRTVGLDASVLGETPNPMDFNILRRVGEEDKSTLDELEAESELNVGEFLKQDLLQFLRQLGEERLQNIPLGMGAIRQGKKDMPRGFFAAFRNPKTNTHHWLFYDEQTKKIIDRRLEAIRAIRCEPNEDAVQIPADFDYKQYIQKLRKHLWDRIRAVGVVPYQLPAPQRQVINWLKALPPSANRNRLITYFEARAIVGPDLKELRQLWRFRAQLVQNELLNRLAVFADNHPQPPTTETSNTTLAPEKIEELECIAWMKVS